MFQELDLQKKWQFQDHKGSAINIEFRLYAECQCSFKYVLLGLK